MNKVNKFALTLGLALSPFLAHAEDQTTFKFDKGNVLIHCLAPDENSMLSTEQFNAAFPHWITGLQDLANEGIVVRAHYLGELKEGIFIVVTGEDKAAARANAQMVLDKNTEILAQALEQTGSAEAEARCETIEIGPVAVLPQ